MIIGSDLRNQQIFGSNWIFGSNESLGPRDLWDQRTFDSNCFFFVEQLSRDFRYASFCSLYFPSRIVQFQLPLFTWRGVGVGVGVGVGADSNGVGVGDGGVVLSVLVVSALLILLFVGVGGVDVAVVAVCWLWWCC